MKLIVTWGHARHLKKDIIPGELSRFLNVIFIIINNTGRLINYEICKQF
jgi:hypothetical protein